MKKVLVRMLAVVGMFAVVTGLAGVTASAETGPPAIEQPTVDFDFFGVGVPPSAPTEQETQSSEASGRDDDTSYEESNSDEDSDEGGDVYDGEPGEDGAESESDATNGFGSLSDDR